MIETAQLALGQDSMNYSLSAKDQPQFDQLRAMSPAFSFYDLSFDELKSHLQKWGKESFRAQQLFRWIYGLGQKDFSQMTNLSKALRDELLQCCDLSLPEILQVHKSVDGTTKYLFDVGEGLSVEAVLIPMKGRRTLCVSSEVGCNMACSFCFTAKQKLKRRLSAREIIGQFVGVNEQLPEDEKITNIVFMGMGEPLDNPEAVFKAIQVLNNDFGVGFSKKKVTISTSGIVPLIPLVTQSGARLAVSLNGVDDEVRSKIMPINKRWPIRELLDACFEHTQASGDRVTFEYVLLRGVTDSIEDARRLYQITKRVPCKINIIPFNEHPQSGFFRPQEDQIQKFQDELIRLGAHVLRRKTMGRDIYAACGQLTTAAKK